MPVLTHPLQISTSILAAVAASTLCRPGRPPGGGGRRKVCIHLQLRRGRWCFPRAVSVGKPLECMDNCCLIRHTQGRFLW